MSRHPMSGAAPGRATETRCLHCDSKVIVVARERKDALVAVVRHLEKDHGMNKTVILDGEDFTVGLAPHRCDLCNTVTEPPWWVYTTPSTLEYPVEDPEWLACEACHRIIGGRALVGPLLTVHRLVERSTQLQLRSTAGLTDPARIERFVKRLQRDLAGFLTHIDREPHQEGV